MLTAPAGFRVLQPSRSTGRPRKEGLYATVTKSGLMFHGTEVGQVAGKRVDVAVNGVAFAVSVHEDGAYKITGNGKTGTNTARSIVETLPKGEFVARHYAGWIVFDPVVS